MESTSENGGVRDALGTARWDQQLGELGSSRLENAPQVIRVKDDARNQADADKHGVVPNPLEVSGSDNEPQSRHERHRQERQQRRQDDSNSDVRNDAGDGHLPLHVENDIADLGTLLSLMQPQDIGRAHEFGPTLEEYAVKGVPVDCGDNWDRATIDTAISRGPHQSALTPDALKLFEEDIAYQVEAGFAKVVLWDDIKHNPPSQLKVSPVAAVPQKNRRDRIILDLSFGVRLGKEIIQQAVNASTTSTSHPSALSFLGSTMPRILKFMAHAPPQHPIFFSKYDVSDGFWRMVVAAGSEWNFAYVLPQEEGNPIKLVVPSALQMGWK